MAHPGTDLPPLIQALLSPARYGPDCGPVELVQTHISWVLLAGDYAYKIKKPVKLPFLDFSTLALRQQCCEDELRLNRRYAPALYLAVLPLYHTPQDPHWSGQGAPIEYAVQMRRFAQDQRLDRVCARGELRPSHLSGLAHRLALLHRDAATAAPDCDWGAPERILAQALHNMDELQALLPEPALQQRLQPLRRWTLAQHTQSAALMGTRQHSGCIRECHGDLHLANLVLMDQQVHIFDCIEFNADMRWMDVASELAFTYVDLLAHHQPGLACWFVNEALSASGDYQSAGLLRWYAVYRALVRAKVSLLQAPQLGLAAAHSSAHAYLALAQELCQPPPPVLLITHGVAGCGKTHATDALLLQDRHAATLRLRSDVERKRLFGLGAGDASGSALDRGIYTSAAQARTYAHMAALAANLLQAHWSVVVDAGFLRRALRDPFRQLAQRAGLRFGVLAPHSSPAQLRTRIQQRLARGQDASEATLEVLAAQSHVLEPLAADEPRWPLPRLPRMSRMSRRSLPNG